MKFWIAEDYHHDYFARNVRLIRTAWQSCTSTHGQSPPRDRMSEVELAEPLAFHLLSYHATAGISGNILASRDPVRSNGSRVRLGWGQSESP